MDRKALYGGLLVAIGLAVGIWLGWPGDRGRVEPADAHREGSLLAIEENPGAGGAEGGGGGRHAMLLERRLELLTAKLAEEADHRRRLEQRLELLATELGAVRGSHEPPHVAASQPESRAVTPAPPATSGGTADPASAREAVTSMERALVAAGIDATTANEITRRRDAISLSEIYLRDQAAREGWLDTPEFAAKMAEIEQQRTSVRDEIGDEAYDRYLAALDQPNRVAVNEVMLESPAAMAGVQAGDVVLRYADTRIFSPGELVTATRGGTAGEAVQMEIIRQGQRFEIQVPRGPLGMTIAASRGAPGEG